MKLVIDTKSFTEAVAWVSKTLDTKDAGAYFALVVDSNGKGYLSHANGQSYTKSLVQVNNITLDDNEEKVELALEAQYTKRLASVLKGDEALEFSKDLNSKTTSLNLKRSQENYTIPLIEARINAEPDYEIIGSVDDSDYFDTLNRLAKLTDPVNAAVLPVIGTVDVKLDPEEKTVTVMATDRYALGEIVIPFAPDTNAEFFKNNENLLILEERASMIAPSKGAVDTLDLIYDLKSKRFGYEFQDGKIALFALSTAQALPYQTIKTSSAEAVDKEAVVNLAELKNAISTISNLELNETNIQLEISDGSFVVSDTHQTNTLNVAIENSNDLTDESTKVRFVRAILNEALSPITTNRVNIKWKDAEAAFIFEPVFDDDTVADNVYLLAVPEK